MNPQLEQALLEHYRREHRRDLIPFTILVVVTALIVVWVFTLDTSGDIKRLPLLGVVGGPCALGSAIMGYFVFRKRPRPLLDRIQTGIPIRQVHRDDVPALRVEFADGSAQTIVPVGNLRTLARIEHLLGLQMLHGSAPPRHARAS